MAKKIDGFLAALCPKCRAQKGEEILKGCSLVGFEGGPCPFIAHAIGGSVTPPTQSGESHFPCCKT